jgi:hypothetical protein
MLAFHLIAHAPIHLIVPTPERGNDGKILPRSKEAEERIHVGWSTVSAYSKGRRKKTDSIHEFDHGNRIT